MSMNPAAEKRARWRRYFLQHVGGSEAEVDAATEAAMRALEQGSDANGIIAAGLEGARAFRDTPQTRTRPSGTGYPLAQHAARPQAPAPRAIGSNSSGIVRGFQERQTMKDRLYYAVWDFRLARTDAHGNPLIPTPIRMIARRFTGAIRNGDLIDVGKKCQEGRLIKTRRVRNLTTGFVVKARGLRPLFLRTASLVLFIILLSVSFYFQSH